MITSKITFLFGAAAAVSALVVPRKDPPAGWWTEGLEDYNVYHTRYLALGCQNQHGQEFFDLCCHPLKKDETLETARAPQCIPSASASASASLAEPTSTVTTPDDEPPTSATSVSESPASSPSSIVNVASGDNGDESDDEGGDEECEPDDEDENSSSSAPSVPESTSAPESTPSEVPAPDPTSSEEHTSSEAPPSTTQASSTSSRKHKETPSSTTSADTSEETSSSSQGSGQTFTGGFATFYYQEGTAGACGNYNSDDALIAAMDYRRYGDTSQESELCGKQVKITNTDNGKSVTVTIADACPTCENENSIDLSTGAFDKIADEQTGMVPISWQFV